MADERWVLLGLAHPRSPWFRDLGHWATSATIAAEFVKCVSAEEVRARLASGRVHSALLVDGSLASFDRDLVATARSWSTPVIAVVDGRGATWSAADLGVAAVLPDRFTREQLIDVLASSARVIRTSGDPPPVLGVVAPSPWRGQLIAVCGSGGTGASTVAIALAQGMAGDVRYGGRVVLADLALRADQAILHDSVDLGPGVQELVEAHRLGQPEAEQVRSTTFEVPRRGYRLLLGLRRPDAWAALRPRATDAAVDGLRRAFQLVVADVTGDFESEADGGSVDVEERNHLSRTTVLQADVVVLVGAPGLKGTSSLAHLIVAAAEAGVDGSRILPVVNRAPRNPRSRAEIAAALSELTSGAGALASPVWVPERKIESALRDGTRLPGAVVGDVVAAARALLDRLADAMPPRSGPTRIAPGELGHWPDTGI